MKLKFYGLLYIGLSFTGWFLDDMLRMMRLLTSFCYQDRLTNIVGQTVTLLVGDS